MADHEGLRGLRILIAEDNVFAALEVEQTLRDFGCEPVGPVASVAEALRLARGAPLDGALLDVDLRGERCFPIAEALQQRDIPVVFATGYDDENLIPETLAGAPRLRKPYMTSELQRVIVQTFARA